jgi:predicted nucleic acid-binding protein
MPKPLKLYWDSCAWIGLLNGEADKNRELGIVYSLAQKGNYELWTSTISMVEVRRLRNEKDDPKPLSEENLKVIDSLFRQPFVKPVPLSVDIAEDARKLFRVTSGLGKWQDAIHLASALKWNAATLHTYDNEDLLKHTYMFTCRNGEKLPICYPDETTDGPLFAKANRK